MLSWLNAVLETHCCCLFLAVKYCLPQHHLILALNDHICTRLVPGFPSVCLLQPALYVARPGILPQNQQILSALQVCPLVWPVPVQAKQRGKNMGTCQTEGLALKGKNSPGSLSHTFRQTITRCVESSQGNTASMSNSCMSSPYCSTIPPDKMIYS